MNNEDSIICEECGEELFFEGNIDDYLDGDGYIECPNCEERIYIDEEM